MKVFLFSFLKKYIKKIVILHLALGLPNKSIRKILVWGGGVHIFENRNHIHY